MGRTCEKMGVVRLSRWHFRRGRTGDLDGVNGQDTATHTEAGIWSVKFEIKSTSENIPCAYPRQRLALATVVIIAEESEGI